MNFPFCYFYPWIEYSKRFSRYHWHRSDPNCVQVTKSVLSTHELFSALFYALQLHEKRVGVQKIINTF